MVVSKKNDWKLSGFHGMAKGFTNNPNNNRQAVTQNMIANHLIELCVNRFEWKNLPPSVDPRYLEMTLFQNALAVFFKDSGSRNDGFTDTDKFYCLPAAGGGLLNLQDVPTHFQVTAPNVMLNVRLEAGKTCVPIWANYLRRPELDKVSLYSQKLAHLDRTIEIATSNLRRTKVVTVPENQRQTFVNIMRQHEEGVQVIFGNEDLQNMGDSLTAVDVSGDPDSVPRLWDAKNQLWNECYTMLGINNANQDKRERLVAAEVDANNEQVEGAKNIALNSRRYAAKQINELFNLNVSVDFRKNEKPIEDESNKAVPNEGDQD